jgi:hypothetical protein
MAYHSHKISRSVTRRLVTSLSVFYLNSKLYYFWPVKKSSCFLALRNKPMPVDICGKIWSSSQFTSGQSPGIIQPPRPPVSL